MGRYLLQARCAEQLELRPETGEFSQKASADSI
jgi:hypothetical protein